ncbi:hypothetical protein G7062_06565 [Erysipelothrix sp. HDW6C]|uniref:hypothetical protein n=1 Tax=Erysipelothrix sp. HDW6C TaxID=2714930 RepID=UPI00140C1849|nr:hypothetical protein [Erysipelothrix sp. HDW6C]QIK69970.1 hypothetical protein G7062_06565 [Erysipelothrix sp. HDW6C]
MKILVVGDGMNIAEEAKKKENVTEYLTLRRGHEDVSDIMEIFEVVEPSQVAVIRDEIKSIDPDKIVVVGRLDGYVWLGTVICRFFGQFNSWNEQRENPYGKTTLNINGKPVELIAIESLDDWAYTA